MNQTEYVKRLICILIDDLVNHNQKQQEEKFDNFPCSDSFDEIRKLRLEIEILKEEREQGKVIRDRCGQLYDKCSALEDKISLLEKENKILREAIEGDDNVDQKEVDRILKK